MIYELIIILLIGIDQISKLLALNYLKDIRSIPIIQNVFHLTYVENRGAAFGMFQNNQIIFIIVALVASIYGLYYLHTKSRYSWKSWNTPYNIRCYRESNR